MTDSLYRTGAQRLLRDAYARCEIELHEFEGAMEFALAAEETDPGA